MFLLVFAEIKKQAIDGEDPIFEGADQNYTIKWRLYTRHTPILSTHSHQLVTFAMCARKVMIEDSAAYLATMMFVALAGAKDP